MAIKQKKYLLLNAVILILIIGLSSCDLNEPEQTNNNDEDNALATNVCNIYISRVVQGDVKWSLYSPTNEEECEDIRSKCDSSLRATCTATWQEFEPVGICTIYVGDKNWWNLQNSGPGPASNYLRFTEPYCQYQHEYFTDLYWDKVVVGEWNGKILESPE